MPTTPLHRLPAPMEAAADRIRHTLRESVEQTNKSLGLAALSAAAGQRSEILAAQFELDRRSAMFLLEFDRCFQDRLRRDCTPRSPTETAPSSNWADLSLVDDREIEIRVTAERLGLEVAARCESELRELEGFITTLLPEDPSGPPRNPLRPDRIALAMLQAAETVSEREELRRTLVAALGASLKDLLGPCYAAIAADMHQAGIEPAGLTVRRQDSRPTETREEGHQESALPPPDPARPPEPGSGARAATPGSGARSAGGLGEVDPRMMSVMRRLAASGADGAEPEGQPAASLGRPTANLIHAHRQELMEASRGALDHLVIEVVGSLFDQILSDPKVPPQMARQIARLQLPVLRAAMGDPRFFSNRRHPVRLFVNRLASMGLALEDSDEAHVTRVMTQVATLVQEIVAGDFERIATYEQRLAALEALLAEAGRQEIARAELDAASLLQRKEQELQLHGRYAQQLQAELRDVPAAEFLREFIAQVWGRVIVHAALAEGPDAPPTLKLRRTAVDLLLSVQPKASTEQRKAFLAGLPALMRAINEGLDRIAWPEAQRKAFLARLLPAHSEALKAAPVRTLEHNLTARRIEAALAQPVPQVSELPATAAASISGLSDEALAAPLSDDEARRLGLLRESGVEWTRAPETDAEGDAEPAPPAEDLHIQGLPAPADTPEPTQGAALADHLQIGFAYRMHLPGGWCTVRLAHISPGRGFFVFTHGPRHRETASLTHRMLQRLCESGRLRAFESAYLIERATARARRQLASLGSGSAH